MRSRAPHSYRGSRRPFCRGDRSCEFTLPLFRMLSFSLQQVVFVDYMVITAHAGGSFAAATVADSSVGACTFVDTVIGIEKEEGQDRLAVRVSGVCRTRRRQRFARLAFTVLELSDRPTWTQLRGFWNIRVRDLTGALLAPLPLHQAVT